MAGGSERRCESCFDEDRDGSSTNGLLRLRRRSVRSTAGAVTTIKERSRLQAFEPTTVVLAGKMYLLVALLRG